MVHPSIIEARLGELGFRASRWFRAEIHELQHILMDDEKIVALACGRYFGSFALLVATDQRLLLIDKRVFFMTIEDSRYDMISEIDLNMQMYAANLTIYTMNKTHKFTSVKNKRQLRELTTYVQRRVWEFRQMQTSADQLPMPPQARTIAAPGYPQPVGHAYYTVRDNSQPQPTAPQPQEHYADQPRGHHILPVLPARAGHAARLVGSAATAAAHHAPSLPRKPFNPYVRGSLMTRRPLGTDYYNN
jgi:PH (Pleckstrin Homology) domain-containing protein